ncbi:trypsin alpha-like [Daphnia carinata]|uniref:trypsin alpha-like n=1 Tax=Daphnia carinata TaxID=120202 RepID=UPI00257E5F72|nr:trypsin alpha-like [Daphnia carinata]
MKPVVLFISIICSVTGLAVLNERIIGGDVATLEQFPYVVSVIENERHSCGGFIYNNRWIITAASCVDGKLPSALKIMAGGLDWNVMTGDEQIISVYNIYIFEGYNRTFNVNDIALIKVTRDIDFNLPNIDFVRYNEVNTDDLTGIVIGWGATAENGTESNELRYGTVDIKEEIQCGDYSQPEFKLSSMICAYGAIAEPPVPTAGSPCQYDQGSPLIQSSIGQDIAVGVMSKTESCSMDSASVYTRLSIFYSWLQQTAGPQPLQ